MCNFNFYININMISQLSEKDIDEIHIIFTIIDRALINDEMSIKIITHYYENEYEHYIYLEWLLLRWVFFKEDYESSTKKD